MGSMQPVRTRTSSPALGKLHQFLVKPGAKLLPSDSCLRGSMMAMLEKDYKDLFCEALTRLWLKQSKLSRLLTIKPLACPAEAELGIDADLSGLNIEICRNSLRPGTMPTLLDKRGRGGFSSPRPAIQTLRSGGRLAPSYWTVIKRRPGLVTTLLGRTVKPQRMLQRVGQLPKGAWQFDSRSAGGTSGPDHAGLAIRSCTSPITPQVISWTWLLPAMPDFALHRLALP